MLFQMGAPAYLKFGPDTPYELRFISSFFRPLGAVASCASASASSHQKDKPLGPKYQSAFSDRRSGVLLDSVDEPAQSADAGAIHRRVGDAGGSVGRLPIPYPPVRRRPAARRDRAGTEALNPLRFKQPVLPYRQSRGHDQFHHQRERGDLRQLPGVRHTVETAESPGEDDRRQQAKS